MIASWRYFTHYHI